MSQKSGQSLEMMEYTGFVMLTKLLANCYHGRILFWSVFYSLKYFCQMDTVWILCAIVNHKTIA